jgi:hypothetical protein
MLKKKLLPNRILVEITEEDRDRLFNKIITAVDGRQFNLITDIQSKNNTDKFYSQTVNMGRVLDIHPDCKQVRIGDIVLFSNKIDSNDKWLVDKSQFRKQVSIIESLTRHTDDYLVPPSGPGRTPKYVWRKGDVDQTSHIVAIFRNDQLVSVEGIVIADYHNDDAGKRTYAGLIYDQERTQISNRVVKVPPPDNSLNLEKGDVVMVPADVILTYDFGPHKFDVFYAEDVLLKFRP